jgi:hypothetical protein
MVTTNNFSATNSEPLHYRYKFEIFFDSQYNQRQDVKKEEPIDASQSWYL